MTEFRRLIDSDDAPSDVRELLRSARGPSSLGDRVRARSRRRVAGLVAIPAASGALAWVGHAALGAVLGGAITAAITLPRALAPVALVAPVTSGAEAHARTALTQMERRGGGGGSTPAKETSEAAPERTPGVAPPQREAFAAPQAEASRIETAAGDPGPSDLTREAALLERAERLVSSDPAAALRLVERHETEFPHGVLAPEREFLAVEALLALGKRSEAESRARALRQSSPGNLYNLRLDHLFAGGSNGGS